MNRTLSTSTQILAIAAMAAAVLIGCVDPASAQEAKPESKAGAPAEENPAPETSKPERSDVPESDNAEPESAESDKIQSDKAESDNAMPDQETLDEVRDAFRGSKDRAWVPKSRMTNSPHVRSAFREVVSDASKATVRVRNNGKDVALGTIVGTDGWVVTKASRLKGVTTVQLMDGREMDARTVGIDRDYDLAMLKIAAKQLPSVELAVLDAESARGRTVSDTNPDDTAGQTVRETSKDEADTSKDASKAAEEPVDMAPAWSPGAWVATVGPERDPIAIGVLSVMPRRILRRPGILGIRLDTVGDTAKVVQVFPNSGAEAAGVLINDMITSINGSLVTNSRELITSIQRFSPGDVIDVGIDRGEKKLVLRATLGGRFSTMPRSRSQMQNSLGSTLSRRRFGFPTALQHDTVLKPADCGGPLVDLDGRVVGINIARAGRTESYAIPSDVLRTLMFDLMSGKLAPRKAS